MKFGKDSNGNYGYIKDGADTVIPFKRNDLLFANPTFGLIGATNTTELYLPFKMVVSFGIAHGYKSSVTLTTAYNHNTVLTNDYNSEHQTYAIALQNITSLDTITSEYRTGNGNVTFRTFYFDATSIKVISSDSIVMLSDDYKYIIAFAAIQNDCESLTPTITCDSYDELSYEETAVTYANQGSYSIKIYKNIPKGATITMNCSKYPFYQCFGIN